MPNIIRCGGGGSYGTLPAQVSNLYATIGNASVALSWTNPSDSNFAGVVIQRKTGGYPIGKTDGMRIYDGAGTSFTDTGLTNGTQYYYRAFAYNSKREYQTIWCAATATPIGGYQLGTFPVGTKLYFGKIYGNPIVFTIANKSGNDITLISDGIIMCGAVDAKEPGNSNSDRQAYGNNRYLYSNINQWLNSQAISNWYSAQHSADQPPSSSYVSKCPYDSAQGFLSNFSAKEVDYIKIKTITVDKSNTDGQGSEALNARMWLPSSAEIGLQNSYVEGTQFALFSDNNSRIAKYTYDCARYSYGTAGNPGIYWLRTVGWASSNITDSVNTEGATNQYASYCNDGSIGIRPCCCLDSSVLISLSPDANGVYSLA